MYAAEQLSKTCRHLSEPAVNNPSSDVHFRRSLTIDAAILFENTFLWICQLSVVSCPLSVVCCSWSVVRGLLFVVCCSWSVVRSERGFANNCVAARVLLSLKERG